MYIQSLAYVSSGLHIFTCRGPELDWSEKTGMRPAYSARITSHMCPSTIRQRTNWVNSVWCFCLNWVNSAWCFCLIKAFLFILKRTSGCYWLDKFIKHPDWCVSAYSFQLPKQTLNSQYGVSNVKYNLSQLSSRYLHPRCSQHAKMLTMRKHNFTPRVTHLCNVLLGIGECLFVAVL